MNNVAVLHDSDGTAFRVKSGPTWVVSFLHHARGEALDKVMWVEFIGGRLPPSFGRSVVRPFCPSVVLSFGRSVVQPFCRSRCSTQELEHVE